MALPDFYSQWTHARQNGAQRANDYTVRQNIGGALQGDSGALSAILKASPQTGMMLQDRAAGQQKAALAQQQEDSGRAALMFSQTGDPQYYAAWRQSLAGLPNAPQLPEALEPDDLEPAKQSAGAYAQAYGGFKGMETPSAIRELQMLQANPELAKLDMQRRQAGFGRPQLIQTADGYAWATPEGASPLNYGGGQPQAPQGQQSGQPFTIDPSLPPNVQAAIRSNEQAWANAPDQATAMLPPTRAQGPRVMPAPKQTAQSELEKRLALADQMGASPEEKRRMVVGGEAARDTQRISTADATKARLKLTQIQTARNQLKAVKSAFAKIKDSYSAGPGGSFIPTPEGQAFDRAVRNFSPLITAVTRVPGVGAMSDFEAKLQEASLPSRGTYESSTAQQIADLEQMINTIEAGYRDLLGEQPKAPAPATQQSGGWSIKVKP